MSVPEFLPKRAKNGEPATHVHDWHHIYNPDDAALEAALAHLAAMREKSIENQRDILAKSKEAFRNEVQKILDAMSSTDDLGSIHAVIADSKFNAHLDAALAAAEAMRSLA